MYSIILLIHSTAAISADAKRIKPKILKIKENLNLKVYENNLFKGFMTDQYKF
jgi:hypothetical protein